MIARRIHKALRIAAPAIGSLIEGCILLAGAAAIAYGAWQAWAPAGPIAGGGLVVAGVLLRARGG